MDRPPCRHCGGPQTGQRPRGLCWGCYYTPGVRDLYPSTSKFGRRGITTTGGYSLPGAASHAAPGSEERLQTLERRAKAGESLWHPDDRTVEDVST